MPSRRIEVLPVIHAMKGNLVGPDATPLEEDLKSVTRRFSREHDALYLVDLDGIRSNSPKVDLVQEVSRRVHTWADAGSRSAEDVMDLVIAGAEQVTIRHHTVQGEDVIRDALRLTENVALGLEFKDQQLVKNQRWPATPPELIQLAEDLRIPLVVVDLSRAGTAQGIDKSVAWHARHHGPGAYFAGGIRDNRDLDKLEDMGYHGALVSTALLEGEDVRGASWSGPADAPEEDEDVDESASGMDEFSPTGGVF